MNRIMAVLYGAGALVVGYLALSIAFKVRDLGGGVLVLVFAGLAAFFARIAWKDWNEPDGRTLAPAPRPAPSRVAQPSADSVRLEDQIAALANAGLVLAPGRTIEELLQSWSREDYEADPWNLLLFMYGSEVEAEPWGRAFCERGWNFDMECLEQAGDYARVFQQIVRITGGRDLVTNLSDDFSPDAETAAIRYTVMGQARTLRARVDNDWADPEAVEAFVRDLEAAAKGAPRFWAADNGQASVLFFITKAEAAKINALSPGILQRYVDA
jgi:hypothetical protein